VCAVELARAVADPEEVRGGVVPACVGGGDGGGVGVAGEVGAGCGGGVWHVPGEALLVVEEQALVAGVEVDGFEGVG